MKIFSDLNMVGEKKLIEFFKVPSHVCLRDFIQELFLLLKLRGTQCKELAGVLIDDSHMNNSSNTNEQKTFMIYLRSEGTINELRKICIKEENEFHLFIFNSKIEVKFPFPGCYHLETEETVKKEPRLDIVRIGNTEEKNVLDMLDLLPNVYHTTSNSNYIASITQSRNSTFIKFADKSDAERVVRCYRRMKYNANFSTTYTFISQEESNNMKPEIKVNITKENNIKIRRKFVINKNKHSPNTVSKIELGRVNNLQNFINNMKTGSWKLMLVKCDSNDEE